LHRNSRPKDVIEGKREGKIEWTGRRTRRRRKELLNDLKVKTRFWSWKKDALHCTLWSSR